MNHKIEGITRLSKNKMCDCIGIETANFAEEMSKRCYRSLQAAIEDKTKGVC